jgi:hypothetical protein
MPEIIAYFTQTANNNKHSLLEWVQEHQGARVASCDSASLQSEAVVGGATRGFHASLSYR